MCPDTLRGVAICKFPRTSTAFQQCHAVIQSNSYVGSPDTDCVGLVNDTKIAREAPPIIMIHGTRP